MVSFVFRWTKGLQRNAESFCIRYFWRTKCKSTETITERCFPCQNKSVCQKFTRSCKKWKSAKIRYTLFLHEALQIIHLVLCQQIFKTRLCLAHGTSELWARKWNGSFNILTFYSNIHTLFWRACIFLLFSSICFLDFASAWSLASFSSFTLSARIFLFASCWKYRKEGITWTTCTIRYK